MYGKIFCILLFVAPIVNSQLSQKIQAKKLQEFKNLVSSRLPHKYMSEDVYLLRWLKARHFNIPNAEAMLMKNIAWREKNKMDSILTEDWDEMNKNYPYSIEGCDNEGRPVVLVPVGSWNVRKAVMSGKSAKMMRYFDKFFEEMTTFVRRAGENGRNISQYNEVFDMRRYNFIDQGCPACTIIYVNMFNTFENYYPDTTIRSWMIGSPLIFRPLWALLYPLLSEHTKDTVFLYGRGDGEKERWERHMSLYIEGGQVTSILGGTKPSPEPIDGIRQQVNGTFTCS